jgi:phosphate transport system substrate-binding protein
MKKTILMLAAFLTLSLKMDVQAADAPMIRIDGSSTVYLLTEAVAEEFQKANRNTRVTVGVSGTGGGMKKFTTGEIDIVNASRAIEAGEIEKAKQNKIDYTEFKVAFDGIAIVVNQKNKAVSTLTTEELKKIWEPGSKIKLWSDLRADLPKETIHLYGPGADSGTFDYFTKAINGKEKATRSDYTSSENDNVLVQGVSGDPFAIGYFGFAYYQENQARLKLVSVQHDGKTVVPSPETIKTGTYKPLSRPLFIYVSNKALQQPHVKQFVKFYMENAGKYAPEVGYVELDQKTYNEQIAKLGK